MYRNELKFLVDELTLQFMQRKLEPLLPYDRHQEEGSYRIRSMYFDTYERKSYRENDAGVEERKIPNIGKFRALKFTCEFANNTSKGVEIIKFDIWYSDDKNHIPLAMDFPLKGGVMKVTLDEISGIKYPLESLIEKK